MRVDVSEGIDPGDWAPSPTEDRVLVGGRTVWTGPFHPPVLVAQPNRWGVIEAYFPDVPCLVEADPAVTGHLPLPGDVVGFVDRSHRPLAEPPKDDTGRRLMKRAVGLGKSLGQIKGVKVAATPFARTLPLLTPSDAHGLIWACAELGLTGLRPLEGLAGGVALTVREEHGPPELDRVTEVIRTVVGR